MTDKEDHEILDEWLGNIVPYSEGLDGLEPDIDGVWCRYDLVRDAVLPKAKALEAERDKLRAALETIACMDIKSGSRVASVSMQRIAKTAIGETENG